MLAPHAPHPPSGLPAGAAAGSRLARRATNTALVCFLEVLGLPAWRVEGDPVWKEAQGSQRRQMPSNIGTRRHPTNEPTTNGKLHLCSGSCTCMYALALGHACPRPPAACVRPLMRARTLALRPPSWAPAASRALHVRITLTMVIVIRIVITSAHPVILQGALHHTRLGASPPPHSPLLASPS